VKGFAEWAKTNWLILVLSVVALAALPTMFYFSSKMSGNLRAGIQKTAEQEYREVGTFTLTYSLPLVKAPDQKAFERSMEANKVYIEQFAAKREAIKAQAAQVGKEAIEFNKNGHKLLLDGVFPKYAEGESQTNSYKFAEACIAAYPQLLKRIKAGTPPDSVSLAGQLTDYHQQQKTRILSQVGGTSLSKEDEEKLTKEMLDQRIGRYRQRASEISVYAEPIVFIDVPMANQEPSKDLPPLTRYWDWQMRYWINEDLIKAVAQANSSSTTGVPGGVVKRILKITIDAPQYNDVADNLLPGQAGIDEITITTKDPAPSSIAVSVTGRYNTIGSGNQYYDLRNATVEMIVSSARLPEFFDALTKTNLMTVLKVDLDRVEPLDDLREGYFYGDEHVVKATLQIETLWLRGWTKPLMPAYVKKGLGVAEDPGGESAPPPG
jgi:hypothetical protein